jgi:aryl-alcohol dehydrogenase-like predicted oxidoreductase
MAQQLPKRKLGASSIEVSALGFGCMSLSGVYGPSEDDAGVDLIRAAIDRGLTLIDTADALRLGPRQGNWSGSAIAAGASRRCARDQVRQHGREGPANMPTAESEYGRRVRGRA